ncbi:hypothetical protein [Kibdelosporangium phytohabitans]|uniref:Uncharacterized protein n=1 Tax=Kibdelosporangium phytohabitans TaxID=860235 RepID=A0A0N9HSD8_9PSEU|nr:hypothetical protein [Kibdelosporangium phytohabitans]ALG06152.1 hypothetical protein AOZ06_03745 [Kibdelosporangium phytohabitans]MBE1465755.1 hypothetical protein [Kibdelosporangium phytohabitans]
MFERESRLAAEEIRTASDRLRELGRKAAPGVWRITQEGALVRLLGREDHEVAVLTGMWAQSTAEYLTAVGPVTAYNIAELMWLSESLVRHGEMPLRLREALLRLARGLDPG